MKINRFIAKNVHNYLNYEINFFQELTFLTGINGSGKTSALKLVLGLISPSYQYLSQIEFEEAQVICSSKSEEEDIKIKAVYNKESNIFNVIYINKGQEHISSDFNVNYKYENDFYDMDDISLLEQQNSEKFDNDKVIKLIRELGTPKFLGLDRKIYEGKNIDKNFINRRIYSLKSKRKFLEKKYGFNAIDNSLEDVQYLIYDYFRKIALEQPKISEDFKKKIFQLSFRFNNDSNVDSLPMDIDKLIMKKQSVIDALDKLEMKYLSSSVEIFFNKMTNLVQESIQFKEKLEEKNDEKGKEIIREKRFEIVTKWINNNSQLKSIDEIITFSNTYQKRISDLRFPIKKLENIVTDFLSEGGKKLIIEGDGELKVELKNKTKTSIFELSSGEKQIVIMIAHLIFDEDFKDSGIFIIDEPEISLHIAWQEIFVDSIIKASPTTQFILATHSPSIIARVEREIYCQDLNRLN